MDIGPSRSSLLRDPPSLLRDRYAFERSVTFWGDGENGLAFPFSHWFCSRPWRTGRLRHASFPRYFMLASAKALFLVGVIALNGARGATCHDDRINYWQGSA